MASYYVRYEDPLNPGDPLRSAQFDDLERAQRDAASTIEEFMAVLHAKGDTQERLLEMYDRHGWRPVILSADATEAPRRLEGLIRERAAAWAHGDAAARWAPPSP